MIQEELDLLHGYLDGTLAEADFDRLQTLLRESAEARRTLRTMATVDVKLQQLSAADPVTLRLLAAPGATTSSVAWGSSRSLAAAAAGMVLGMFCTSVVLGYIAPTLTKSAAITLLDESFEDVAAPQPAGVPLKASVWGGDFSEIVGSQHGVIPRGGAKMWRFLRADNALSPEAPASYVAEAFYVIDLKPLRTAGVAAESQIEISAWFAQGEASPDLRYHWNIKAAAFEGSIADAPILWKQWDETIASLARREVPVGQSGRWQRLSVTLLLPANADFLVFECAAVQRQPRLSQGVAEFPAHYIDDVHVRLLPSTSEAPSLE